MLKRWLDSLITDPEFGTKMRFIGGPRQSGKTTLARSILAAFHSEDLYYNWDIPSTRQLYRQDSLFYRRNMEGIAAPWACMDEIHKTRQWKNILKGIYDLDGDKLTLLVTGSARLVPARRAGDSLAGRYFLFHLHPVLCGELAGRPPMQCPPQDSRVWIEQRLALNSGKETIESSDAIWRFGPFPEPLLKGKERFAGIWRQNYLDAVIRGDLRDLTRIQDLELVENLIEMIPARVGSPFSTNAAREDLGVAFATVKRALSHLERLFVIFSLPPYTGALTRPVKKERKVYLYEWSPIQNAAARFENWVAQELLALSRFWTESGNDQFSVAFVRSREGKESDFVILRKKRPWCLIECKLHPSKIDSHHLHFAEQLGGVPVIQFVKEHGFLQAQNRDTIQVSLSRFLI